MNNLNVEIKARYENLDKGRAILKSKNAEFKGEDYQIDTYFNVPKGRLKLREGNIENGLIYYERPDTSSPKSSKFEKCDIDTSSNLKNVLANSLSVLRVVDKKREIYFLDNIKIHLDSLEGLGTFIEFEARKIHPKHTEKYLLDQVEKCLKLFEVNNSDLCTHSYSDMI